MERRKNNEKKNELHHNLSRIVKTSVIVLLGLVLSKLLNYAYRIIIARGLGPEAYGLFSLATMIAGAFIALSSIGLSEGLLRFIPIYRGTKKESQIRYLLRFSSAISIISGAVGGIILFLISSRQAFSIIPALRSS
jgi:stage V sporulation protein B